MSDRSRHLRRQFASASVAFMMLALAGCGSNADSDVGHLEGTVATKGGPSGAIHRVEATVVATPLDGDGDPYSVQTDGNGRFRFPYAFSDDDSRGVRFLFRAYAPPQPGWPYEPAASRPVAVTGY